MAAVGDKAVDPGEWKAYTKSLEKHQKFQEYCTDFKWRGETIELFDMVNRMACQNILPSGETLIKWCKNTSKMEKTHGRTFCSSKLKIVSLIELVPESIFNKQDLFDVIIHEMTHALCAVRGLPERDNVNHGSKFNQTAKEILKVLRLEKDNIPDFFKTCWIIDKEVIRH